MTDADIIKEIKYKLDLRFDNQVAALLGVTKQTVADIRSGKRQLPPAARFVAWDKLGYAYTRDAVLWILGSTGERIRTADNERAAERIMRGQHGDEESGAADDEWT